MSSTSIQKQLMISHGNNCQSKNLSKVRKYRFQLSFFKRVDDEYYPMNYKLFKDILHDQKRKRITRANFSYWLEKDQSFLVNDIQRASCMRRFNFGFERYLDFDFYKSRYETNSQFTVYSEDEEDSEDSENELDLAIESPPSQEYKRNIKKIFKQAKRVNDLSLSFEKIDPNYSRAFRYLPLLNMLENCRIKIKIRAPTDLLPLRELLNQTKRRNLWPNIKSMVIKLRHSYNKENCTSKFIHFCRVLQEISEIAQELLWIKIQLKIRYMWRLDETAIFALKETFEKAPNRYVKLSFFTGPTKDLKPLFKTIGELNNLQKLSLRCNKLSDVESLNSLEELPISLKKIQSFRKFKFHQKNLFDMQENDDVFSPTKRISQNLADLSQISSFHLEGEVSSIDKTLWGCFSNSISKLSQLRALTIDFRVTKAVDVFPDSKGFIDFFAGLKNLHSLRIFSFDFVYHSFYDYHPEFQRINGSQIFKTLCQVLVNLKELENFHFRCPWISSHNSDVEELTKIIPNLQKLQRLSFDLQVTKSLDPIENLTFLKFAKVICALPSIESIKISFQLKEISSSTYEAALLVTKKFKRKSDWKLHLISKQYDEQVSQKLKNLSKNIWIW